MMKQPEKGGGEEISVSCSLSIPYSTPSLVALWNFFPLLLLLLATP